ncbi:MAG: type II toxin-antitoxin system HicB family antitoxin [Beijerinckiaceae bacterium]|nr:type II toxin-antitoxin system HicB family antitoxin [Beijerinckiaceae bacterium]
MTRYVAIVEEENGKAVGVWFPALSACVSAGDTLNEAMLNAAEALELWAGAMIESGQDIPRLDVSLVSRPIQKWPKT